jgi:hypothetical protein
LGSARICARLFKRRRRQSLKRLGRADARIALLWIDVFRCVALFTISAQHDGYPVSAFQIFRFSDISVFQTLAYTCEFVYMYAMLAKMLRINPLLATAALAACLLWPAVSRASELVMFEQGGCVWCARWNRDVGTVYDKTAEAKMLPLRRVDIDRQSAAGVTLAAPVRYTPTFVVVDNGREIGRITGYVSDDAFWGLLDALAAKLEAPPATKI